MVWSTRDWLSAVLDKDDPALGTRLQALSQIFCIAMQYAIYAAGAVAASGAVAFGVWKWRRRYLRTGRLFG